MENEKLKRLLHNKKFLFIVPNLICAYQLLYYYNTNFKYIGEVLFYQVILLFLILLVLNSIIYLFLKKALKDEQKTFCILSLISIFYFVQFDLISFLIFVVSILLIILDFKKFIHCKLDYGVALVSFIVIFLFSFNFLVGIYNVSYLAIKSKNYDYELDIKVEEDTETPNIYWVHCDGMLGLDAAKKYFNYKKKDLETYFKDNDYIVNEDARLVVGHSTQRSLVAMFNPYYYDNFFKDYLMELENTYVNQKEKTSFIVNYDELQEKRLNNELFQALEEKNYTTVAIADWNQHTSLDVDYYYDYYVFSESGKHLTEKQELRYMKRNNSDFMLSTYTKFNHFRALLNTTFLYSAVEDINPLNYETLDYNDLDLNNYPRTDDSSYWNSKAILKSINHSLTIDNNKFVFIDYKLNHLPITYDAFGNEIDESYKYNLSFYLGNYIYASKLLMELLEYIHDHDENAVIIVQGDHGIHMLTENDLMNQLSITKEDVQEIRNSVISSFYIPEQYQNGDEKYLDNPLNISRYLINNYIGKNYDYID